jgi:glutathione synthase/RimK-type ligase-like ATP-grasp enzyme
VRSLAVVGNPENRRVALFVAAVRSAGLPEPAVLSWLDVVRGADLEVPPGALVRLDSPGENGEVDRLLRRAVGPARHGELVGLAAWYEGFAAALARVAALARAAGATLLQEPAEILTMFDKRACHRLLRDAAVPVPPALPAPSSYAELRGAMAEAGWSRVFVKPAHGSSAAGVIALRVHKGRTRATTPLEESGGRLFNSLRVREYHEETTVARLVDRLAPDGLHVERWFPKAALDGRAMRTCARVARCFPGSLHVGVDLMFSPDWRRHAVAEVNAFGDLLPGLLVEGQDTYGEQVAALRRRYPAMVGVAA